MKYNYYTPLELAILYDMIGYVHAWSRAYREGHAMHIDNEIQHVTNNKLMWPRTMQHVQHVHELHKTKEWKNGTF